MHHFFLSYKFENLTFLCPIYDVSINHYDTKLANLTLEQGRESVSKFSKQLNPDPYKIRPRTYTHFYGCTAYAFSHPSKLNDHLCIYSNTMLNDYGENSRVQNNHTAKSAFSCRFDAQCELLNLNKFLQLLKNYGENSSVQNNQTKTTGKTAFSYKFKALREFPNFKKLLKLLKNYEIFLRARLPCQNYC